MRYDGFPGSPDIQTDLERAIKAEDWSENPQRQMPRDLGVRLAAGADAGDSDSSGADVEDTGS